MGSCRASQAVAEGQLAEAHNESHAHAPPPDGLRKHRDPCKLCVVRAGIAKAGEPRDGDWLSAKVAKAWLGIPTMPDRVGNHHAGLETDVFKVTMPPSDGRAPATFRKEIRLRRLRVRLAL